MNQPFAFSVRGTPRPQPRPRFVRGRVVSTADAKAKLWRMAVAAVVDMAKRNFSRVAPLFTGPVRVRMVFTFEPPANCAYRLGLPHTHKPDASNLAKLIEDVMEAHGVFANDSQVSVLEPEKWWGERAGVLVLVEPVERRAEPTAISALVRPGWLGGRASDGG